MTFQLQYSFNSFSGGHQRKNFTRQWSCRAGKIKHVTLLMNSRHWCFILQMSRTRYFGSIRCLRLASTNGLFTNSITLISVVYTVWNFKLDVIPFVPFIKFYIKIFVLASHQVNALQEVASRFAMKLRVSDQQGIIRAKKIVLLVKTLTYTEKFLSAMLLLLLKTIWEWLTCLTRSFMLFCFWTML